MTILPEINPKRKLTMNKTVTNTKSRDKWNHRTAESTIERSINHTTWDKPRWNC